ncbi:hypothetical protein PHLGIDRAFT_440746 [Phlebiopsis gigantea 11061_1 CR5-6]|uniref:Uncharacterized protein n=1 Tax=Phlebiopsis gigantea (strain 11061_1 CR5-6) TaxID=745531 RepID=A0A0C3S6F4_PHLG1|nr:hypothetical protein PHLGIDRAFT_440746 [Phlebiopsis gigantea 11061_1 CR5-6]
MQLLQVLADSCYRCPKRSPSTSPFSASASVREAVSCPQPLRALHGAGRRSKHVLSRSCLFFGPEYRQLRHQQSLTSTCCVLCIWCPAYTALSSPLLRCCSHRPTVSPQRAALRRSRRAKFALKASFTHAEVLLSSHRVPTTCSAATLKKSEILTEVKASSPPCIVIGLTPANVSSERYTSNRAHSAEIKHSISNSWGRHLSVAPVSITYTKRSLKTYGGLQHFLSPAAQCATAYPFTKFLFSCIGVSSPAISSKEGYMIAVSHFLSLIAGSLFVGSSLDLLSQLPAGYLSSMDIRVRCLLTSSSSRPRTPSAASKSQ